MENVSSNAPVLRMNAVPGDPGERRSSLLDRRTFICWCSIIAFILVAVLSGTVAYIYTGTSNVERRSLPSVLHRIPEIGNIRPEKTEIVHDHSEIVRDNSEIVRDNSEIVHGQSEIIHEHSEVFHEHSEVFHEHSEIVRGQSEIVHKPAESSHVVFDKEPEGSFKQPKTNPYNQLVHQIRKRGLEVFRGPFLACVQRGLYLHCADAYNTIKGVLEWEARAIVDELADRREELNAADEVETIIAHKLFLNINGPRYKNAEEYVRKYFNFRKNKKLIEDHNSNPDKLYTMAYSWASEYSDADLGLAMNTNSWSKPMYMYENGEFVDTSKYSGSKKGDEHDIIHKDWRDRDVIGPVVDQGKCGSCWAVAATGLVDAYRAITTGERVWHSAQQVLDCSSKTYNCAIGGDHELALNYAATSGLCSAAAYPYSGKKTACKETSCGNKFQIKNIKKLSANDIEDHLRNHGPVVVFMLLSRAFMHYSSGIFDGSCDSKLAHSVMIVGFGENTKYKKNFWIVKNSWGDLWGDGGYFKLYRLPFVPSGESTFCGIDSHAFGITTD